LPKVISSPEKPKRMPGDTPITEAEFERYRLAHEAHFVKKDYALALVAWSDYLAHSPSGRLVVEARYNQALCLLKLRRVEEAKAALGPFVSGVYGSYRRGEAEQVLATLIADAGRE
jgi:TolA-binding protein